MFNRPGVRKLAYAAVGARNYNAKRDSMYRRMQNVMEESGSYLFLTRGVNAVLHRDTIKPSLSPSAQRYAFRDFELAE